jgi:hypothetical protein
VRNFRGDFVFAAVCLGGKLSFGHELSLGGELCLRGELSLFLFLPFSVVNDGSAVAQKNNI